MAKDADCPPGCTKDINAQVSVEGPKVSAEVKVPDVEVKAPKVEVKGPEVEVKGPKVDVKGPEVDVKVKGPEVDVKVQGPEVEVKGGDISITKPKYKRICLDCEGKRWGDDFMGRVRNYMAPRRFWYMFLSENSLKDAKCTMKQCLQKRYICDKTEDEVYRAKHIFESTFHPHTGEKISMPARKAFSVPVDGLITGLMMTFYRSIPGIILGQWAKQTYTSGFDYSNRNCDYQYREIAPTHYKMAYAAGTAASVMTAIGLGSLIKKHHHPILGRLIPFAGVAAATLLYVPFLNVNTLQDGWPCRADYVQPDSCPHVKVSEQFFSINAAPWALSAETIGKVLMVVPPMVIPPFVMHFLEYEKKFFCRRPWAQAPTQITLCCLCLMYITPLIRGLFPDWSPLPYCQLEECLQEKYAFSSSPKPCNKKPPCPSKTPCDYTCAVFCPDDCPDPSPCEKDEEPEPPVIDPCKKEEIENPPAEEEVQKEGAEESKTAKDEKPAEECKTAKDEKPTEGTEPSDDKNETKKKKIPFFENAYIRIRID